MPSGGGRLGGPCPSRNVKKSPDINISTWVQLCNL